MRQRRTKKNWKESLERQQKKAHSYLLYLQYVHLSVFLQYVHMVSVCLVVCEADNSNFRENLHKKHT